MLHFYFVSPVVRIHVAMKVEDVVSTFSFISLLFTSGQCSNNKALLMRKIAVLRVITSKVYQL